MPSHDSAPAEPVLPLQGLVEIARLVGAQTPVDELLDSIAWLAARTLGFRAVAINLYRPADDVFEVATVACQRPEAAEVLLGDRSSAEVLPGLLVPEFEVHGAYFIPAGSFDWDSLDIATYHPPAVAPVDLDDPEAWHPGDELLVPMRSASGELLGILSVGDPADGRRPGRLRLQALVAVASHAALAVEQRQVDATAAEHAAALERLFAVSSRLSQTLDPGPTLRMIRDAVDEALGFAEVTLALRDDRELAAAAAQALPQSSLVMSIEEIEALLEAGEEREGTFLLREAQVAALWPGPPPSACAGAGPRAFRGHLLLSPLFDDQGETAGLLAVAAPRDRQLPDDARLRTLTMFAGQAAATLHSAAGRALEQERERAEHLAAHDLLTGLPNRDAFLAALRDRLDEYADGEAARAVSVLFLDLNDFKIVNDARGHHDGDELLREVATRVQTAAQPHGVSRLGGDEFAVLVDGTEDDAHAIAERIHAALRVPVAVSGVPHRVSAGIGITTAAPGQSASEVTQHADIAMYQAKAAGRGTVAYDASTDQAASRLATETALRAAPGRGELELHYQPIVSARDGAPVSLEALVRWRRDGQLVPPLDFIPLAESSGAIEAIGRWVIGEAARQARVWQGEGLEVPPIAVNVSPRQLRGGDLAETVATALEHYGLDSSALSIELTESALLPDLRADAQLQELRELGVSCAIDDFGSDYSSLDRLQALPVDVLKIDRAFMREVPDSLRATDLLHAIIGLADALQLEVVVEGIETAEQHAELRAARTGLQLQGFYFSRPLPADELAAWLASRLTRAA